MIKLFTHTDLDGIGCAILARIAFNNEVDIEYCNHNRINQRVSEFIDTNSAIDCYITDIGVSEEVAKKIDKQTTSRIILLDHHGTMLHLNQYNWCKVATNNEQLNIQTSGTELFYEHLLETGKLQVTKGLNNFVSVVRDYDTWRWSTLGEEGKICKQVNDLFFLYGVEEFTNWAMTEIEDNTFPYIRPIDKLVLDIKQKEIDTYIAIKDKQLVTLPLKGYTCGFVYAEEYFSELGNRLCRLHPEIDFVAMIDMGRGAVEYRTVRDDINLGTEIAKPFGGGGHPKAAGSPFPKEISITAIQQIFFNNKGE